MLATIKTGEAAARANLRTQLVLERLTGRVQEAGFVTQAMQDGIDREETARCLYTDTVGWSVDQVGFVSHDDLMAGCSPDGVIGSFDGIVEIKCPIATTHLAFIKSGLVPDKYVRQCVHNMWITGAKWCDYVSYQPDFPEQVQMCMKRIKRDEKTIENYEAKVKAFLAEVDTEVQAVRTLVDSAEQWAKSLEISA